MGQNLRMINKFEKTQIKLEGIDDLKAQINLLM